MSSTRLSGRKSRPPQLSQCVGLIPLAMPDRALVGSQLQPDSWRPGLDYTECSAGDVHNRFAIAAVVIKAALVVLTVIFAFLARKIPGEFNGARSKSPPPLSLITVRRDLVHRRGRVQSAVPAGDRSAGGRERRRRARVLPVGALPRLHPRRRHHHMLPLRHKGSRARVCVQVH